MSKIPVYDVQGKKTEALNLDLELPIREEENKTFSCAVRVLRQNWRQGTIACKTRSDVSFSNKKPWKQKGTGRARAGSLRSPLWRKGGVTFGPQRRSRQLSINREQVRKVLGDILRSFLPENNESKIYCLNFENSNNKPNTKEAFNVLKNIGLNNKKIVLFLTFDDEIHFASFRNIPNVNVLCFDQPNSFHLSDCDCWVFLKKDLETFKKMVSTWN